MHRDRKDEIATLSVNFGDTLSVFDEVSIHVAGINAHNSTHIDRTQTRDTLAPACAICEEQTVVVPFGFWESILSFRCQFFELYSFNLATSVFV